MEDEIYQKLLQINNLIGRDIDELYIIDDNDVRTLVMRSLIKNINSLLNSLGELKQ
jgi:hypothetical protein